MRKFLSKAKIRLLTLGLLTVIVIAVAGNVSLLANRDMIAEAINGYLDYEISIGSVYYAFPDRIIIAPVRIKKTALAPDQTSLVLSGMAARFSVWNLITSGKLNVPKVTIYPSKVSYYALSQFLEDNYERILEFIRNASGKDLKVRVHETLLNFDRKGEPDYIAMELLLTLKDKKIDGTGLFRADQYRFAGHNGKETRRMTKGWPLWYKISGELMADGFLMDQFILNSGNFYSRLWGTLQSGLLEINGFAFMDTTKQNPDETGYSFAHYINNFPDDEQLAYIDTYILDIKGLFRLAYPVAEVEKLVFSLNNLPVTLRGSISLLDPLTVDTQLSLRKSPPSGGWRDYFESAQLNLHGTWKDKVLNTNGHMDIDFKNAGSSSLAPEMAKFTFKDLSLYVDPAKRTVLNLASGDIVYFINTNEHKISVADFRTVTTREMEGYKSIEISGPFYHGTMNGRMWFDVTQNPAKITALVLLNDVDTDALEELLIQFAKFNGRMSSKVNFTNVPKMELSGDMTVYDGQLTDFDFFEWVADSFSLPALKAIDFERGSAQFTVNEEHVLLHDVRLRTDNVHIGGYYKLDSQNLVASELSLELSRALLNESPKFKPLLKTYKKEDAHLNFDFRLSGNIGAVNFQWLPSEVKRQIQGQIPDFIERKIEQNIDEMMAPAPKGAP